MTELWPWVTLALLGAYHGLNPAMGWLFAVALGLQEQSRAAVVRAFAPIALGHAASIGAVVVLVGAAQAFVSPEALHIGGAIALVAFALYRMLRTSHPRWVGMRVNFRDLATWSLLMATAHGAGLMLVPVLMQMPSTASSHAGHAAHAGHMAAAGAVSLMPVDQVAAVALHTAAMFLVMGVIAVVVYEKIGLAILRRAWFNLDRVWTGALLAAGLLTLAL